MNLFCYFQSQNITTNGFIENNFLLLVYFRVTINTAALTIIAKLMCNVRIVAPTRGEVTSQKI